MRIQDLSPMKDGALRSVRLSGAEVRTLQRAAAIAGKLRGYCIAESDLEIRFAEIQHGCRETIEDSMRGDIPIETDDY